MALKDYDRRRFFKGWCSGLYVAERETKGTIPLYQETFTVRITRFNASECTFITEVEYDTFEHDLDGGYLAEGDFTWSGTLYRHQASGLKIRSVDGPQGVTRDGMRTFGEFTGPFVGYVSEVVQLEVPDEPERERDPVPPPEPRTQVDHAQWAAGSSGGGCLGQGLPGLLFHLLGGAFALWSIIAVLGLLPGLALGLIGLLVFTGITGLLGGVFGGLLRYTLQAGFSLLSLTLLFGMIIGSFSFLFDGTNTRVKVRKQENSQRTTRREVKERTMDGSDTSIVSYMRWNDNDRVTHEMEWEVLRSECLRSLVHLQRMAQERTTDMSLAAVYDSLRIHDSIPLSRLAGAFAALQSKEHLPADRLADVVVTCVQSIPYSLVLESLCPAADTPGRADRPCKGMVPFGVNPPSAFMGDLEGDCDTRALLLVAVLQRLGFDAVILLSDHYRHAMLGLALPSQGASILSNGKPYYFWETTNTGFRLGEIHPECSDLTQWSVVGT